MTKGEIAMQLTLALIAQGSYRVEGSTNESIGQAIVEIYNTISGNINIRGSSPDNY